MTLLPHDSLVFKLAGGGPIPCCAGAVNFELIGDGAVLLDDELLRNAAVAVLHYFKNEMGRDSVSPEEFSTALETVLHKLGLIHVKAASVPGIGLPSIAEADLCALVVDRMELLFFQRLREELRRHLQPGPRLVRFYGLRDCVKQLAGAKRWTARCQTLNDQIVEHLRTSLNAEKLSKPCGLVVL